MPVQRPADSPSDDDLLSDILERSLLKEFYAQKAAEQRAAREAAAEQVPVIPIPAVVVPVATTSSPVRRTRSTGGLGPRLVYEAALPTTLPTAPESPAELRK